MEQRMKPDDAIMLQEVKAEWLNLQAKKMPLQEKFKHLIQFAKTHWMVIWQPSQMQNTIMALGSVYKDESEEKWEAYKHLTGMLLRTQTYVNELIGIDEETLNERSENLAKFHDPKDPEKQLLPLNWNDLWLKEITFDKEGVDWPLAPEPKPERKLEISEEEAKAAINWWENPNADNLERIDKTLIKRLKDFVKNE